MKNRLKSIALAISAGAFRAASIFGTRPSARALLRHLFLFPGETRAQSIDRLRRELEWLRRAYQPISLPEFVAALTKGHIVDSGIIYTTDDIQLDVFHVAEEFRSFEIPFAVYVPVGWITTQDITETGLLVEAVTAIEWYEGEEAKVTFGTQSLLLSRAMRTSTIDWILGNRDVLLPHLEELCSKISELPGSLRKRHAKRSACNWAELRELASRGVHVAPHSVSHVVMSHASPIRRQFELVESRRIIEENFGPCTSFAYPYGTREVHNEDTATALQNCGYQAAFLTHSDVITASSPPFELPRIYIPDRAITLEEFRARVNGAGIWPQRLRRHIPEVRTQEASYRNRF